MTTTTDHLATLRTQHAAECDLKYVEFPGQEINRAHYDSFRAAARLGKITKAPTIKGRKALARGTMVLFTIDEHDPTLAHVWAPGYSALIDSGKVIGA